MQQQQTLYISSRPPSRLSCASGSPAPGERDEDVERDDDTSPNPNDLVEIKIEIDDEEVLPRLRLNVGLASDPALQPDAKDIKGMPDDDPQPSEHDDRSSDTSSPFPIITPSSVLLGELTRRAALVKSPPVIVAPSAEPSVVRAAGFVCDPCGIKFSSLSTLEAHQTYYCSHSRKEGGDNLLAIAVKPGSSTETATVGSTNADAQVSNSSNAHHRPQAVSRTGKQYACTHCSYSADKKVSLNRHMRMHQSSPATTSASVTSNGDGGVVVDHPVAPSQLQLVDRYCSDCDIRFSSTKTYRAHKQHYCSGRQRDAASSQSSSTKASTPKSRSQSPHEVNKSPPAPVAAPQPYLALPTNPIIIIPYSLIRAASILPGPL